ncbi:hypothetical protein N9S30_00015 [bacterium]|nr:hypothetical protein [bacterium]
MSREQKNESEERLKSIKKEAWGKRSDLGKVSAFKKLQADLAELDLKACTSWVCPHPILSTSQFHKKNDCLQPRCKPCDSGEGKRARVAAGKRANMAVANAVAASDDKFLTFDVENVASDWLIPEMATRGIELPKTNEFRTADNGARLAGSTDDSWLQVQLKANGPFSDDGTTPLPNDRLQPRDGGGRALFSHCTGYADMLMIFVKTRIADAEGNRNYTAWACNGSDMTTDHPVEHTDGTLGPGRIAPITLYALAERIRTSTLPRVTWEHMFLDVTHVNQRKEIVLMLATRATGATVEFPIGNQTAVDCHVDGVAEQVKTFNIRDGSAGANHNVKGHRHRAYTADDGIKRLREGMIVKSGGKYYLLYAHQPLHELLVHGIFAHDGYRDQSRSDGQGSISIPLGPFQLWLKGEKRGKVVGKQCQWLERPAFGFRRPIEIKPGEYGITVEWLENAAQEAANPDKFPSDTQLDELDKRIEQHEIMLEAGIERRAAEVAAKEARAAAAQVAEDRVAIEAAAEQVAEDRVAIEAASSSGAGPSYVTNNITINNFNGDVTEPAAKRLCQSSIRGFF